MNPDSLLERIEKNGPALGAWMFLREPLFAATASKAGFDFVCIDMQHGMMDFSEMTRLVDALHLGGSVPLVRAASIDTGLTGRYLDAGVAGIIFPMVNNKDQAKACVEACLYPEAGERSMGAIGSTLHYGDDYFDKANAITLPIPMIETREAVENLDDILAVEHVDMIFVGPSDLAISYGLPPADDNPDEVFQDALYKIVSACNEHNVIAGIYSSTKLARKRLDQGFRMVSVTTDWDCLIGGLLEEFEKTKRL